MKRIIRIKKSVKRVVRTIPAEATTDGRARRVIITKTTTSKRRSVR